MNEDVDNFELAEYDGIPPSHNRILVIMAVVGMIGGFIGIVFVSFAFGFGILTGIGLAFVNYYWLRYSLNRLFTGISEDNKPRYSIFKHLLRYLSLGGVVAVIFITGILPIVVVIVGMAGFGFAVIIEGIIKIFITLFSQTKD